MSRLQEVVSRLQQNYLKILEQACNVCSRICIMLQYKPGISMDHQYYGVYSAIGSLPGPASAEQKLNLSMETCYKPILEFAREKNLPVIDLPNTFYINDDDMYISQ